MRRGLIGLLLLPLLLGAAAAPKAGGLEAGWWWRAQVGAGGPDLPAAGSGVPAGQYAVEYSGHQATARTALQVPLGDATSGNLVLKVDPTASVNPGSADITACVATDGWPREEGGRWANQPLFDCSGSSPATFDAEGPTLTIDLAPLAPFARDGIVNVLLTPTQDVSTPSITPTVPEEPSPGQWRVVTAPLPAGAKMTTGTAARKPAGGGAPQQHQSDVPPLTTSDPAPPQPPADPMPDLGTSAESFDAPAPAPFVAAPEPPPEVAEPLAAPADAAPPLAPAPAAAQPQGRRRPRWGLGLLVGLVGLGTFVPQQFGRDRVAALQRRAAGREEGTAALEVHDLGVSFGGVRAVDGVSFTVPRGQILGLIGPNGAGKTTVLDAITGLVPATGRTIIDGVDVSNVAISARCAIGLGRSFQDGRLFPSLTVRDTIAVSLEQHSQRLGAVTGMIGWGPSRDNERDIRRRVDELLDMFGLRAFANKFVSELSTGSRRMVDLATQVAHGARLILLDEPSSGIAQKETEALGPVLLQLRDRLGCTIVIIEHDMPLITGIADRLIALEVGRVIADGTPEEVTNDPYVIEAYLGSDDATINRSGVASVDATVEIA